jgi:hypothetical protein
VLSPRKAVKLFNYHETIFWYFKRAQYNWKSSRRHTLNLNTREPRSWSDFNAKRSWWITLNNFLLFSSYIHSSATRARKEFLFAFRERTRVRDKRTYHHRRAYNFFFVNIKRSFNDILRWGSMKEHTRDYYDEDESLDGMISEG